jgi:hypothetical protein
VEKWQGEGGAQKREWEKCLGRLPGGVLNAEWIVERFMTS